MKEQKLESYNNQTINQLSIFHGGNLYKNEVNHIVNKINYTPKVIFDIGANVGGFSIALSQQYSNCPIYSFEPLLETFNILKSNIEFYQRNLNECINIQPINFGLSDVTKNNVPIGMPALPRGREHNYGRATLNYSGKSIGNINLIEFTQLCNDNELIPDIIKIDVEGCEYMILSNAEKSGILSKIKTIYIEINNHPATKESAQKSKNLLLKYFDIVGDSGMNHENGEPLNYIFNNKGLK
jgi:FkbM family methyltransferase